MKFVCVALLLISVSGLKTEKICRFRDHPIEYTVTYFNYMSGYNCFSYSQGSWFDPDMDISINQTYEICGNSRCPVYTATVQGIEIKFDFTNATSLSLIKTLFSKDLFYQKWYDCSAAADNCCRFQLNEEDMFYNITGSDYPCPALWDAWNCFPKARANTVVYNTCPLYTISAESAACALQSEKYCLETSWNHKTNYGTCADAPIYRIRHNFHVKALYVAIGLMIPSIIIYLTFSKLWVFALSLHRNIIFAIFAKNILVEISKNLVILDALETTGSNNVLNNDEPGCRSLAFFENWSKNIIFTCMSVDAYYMHKAIVRPFKRDNLNIHVITGISIGISVVPTIVWAILKGVNNKGSCWMVDDEWYQWITDGYKYLMLVINVILLIDIVRVFITKISQTDSVNRKLTKQAIKATLIMLILFGIPLLVASNRSIVDMDDCEAGNIYYYVTYSIEAAQGILLSFIFCYLKTEVHKEFSRYYRKCSIATRNRCGCPERRNTKSRRATTVTNVSTKF